MLLRLLPRPLGHNGVSERLRMYVVYVCGEIRFVALFWLLGVKPQPVMTHLHTHTPFGRT